MTRLLAAMFLAAITAPALSLDEQVLALLRALQENGELPAYLEAIEEGPPSPWGDCIAIGACSLPKLESWKRTIEPHYGAQIPEYHVAKRSNTDFTADQVHQAQLNQQRRNNYDFVRVIAGDPDKNNDYIPDQWQREPRCPSPNTPDHLRGDPTQAPRFPAYETYRDGRVLRTRGDPIPGTFVYQGEFPSYDHSDGALILDFWRSWHAYVKKFEGCRS